MERQTRKKAVKKTAKKAVKKIAKKTVKKRGRPKKETTFKKEKTSHLVCYTLKLEKEIFEKVSKFAIDKGLKFSSAIEIMVQGYFMTFNKPKNNRKKVTK